MLRNALLAGLLAIAPSCQCLEIPKWQDPPDAGGVLDAGKKKDSTPADAEAYSDVRQNRMDGGQAQDVYASQADVRGLDAVVIQDAQYLDVGVYSDVRQEDIGRGIIDSGKPDVGNQPNPCYSNNFDEEDDLTSLLFQGGQWSRHPDGYLQQTESNPDGTWGFAHIKERTVSDFEATVRIRTLEDNNPRMGVGNKHTGLVFRYDMETGAGYVLQMEGLNRDSFFITLTDMLTRANVQTIQQFCGEIGCQINVWEDLRLRAEGDRITVYLQERELFSVQNNLYSTGSIGFAAYPFNASHFDDVEICPTH